MLARGAAVTVALLVALTDVATAILPPPKPLNATLLPPWAAAKLGRNVTKQDLINAKGGVIADVVSKPSDAIDMLLSKKQAVKHALFNTSYRAELYEALNDTKESIIASWPGWEDVLPAKDKAAALEDAKVDLHAFKDELTAKFFNRQNVSAPSPLRPGAPSDLTCYLDPATKRLVGLYQSQLLLGARTSSMVNVTVTDGWITGLTVYVVGGTVRAATIVVSQPDGPATAFQCGAVPLLGFNAVRLVPGAPGTRKLTSITAPFTGVDAYVSALRDAAPDGRRRGLLQQRNIEAPQLKLDDIKVTVAPVGAAAGRAMTGQQVLYDDNFFEWCTRLPGNTEFVADSFMFCLINYSDRAVRVAGIGGVENSDWENCRPDGQNGHDLIKNQVLKPDESRCFRLDINGFNQNWPFELQFEPVDGEPGPRFPSSSVRVDLRDLQQYPAGYYRYADLDASSGIFAQVFTGRVYPHYVNFILRDPKPDLSDVTSIFNSKNPHATLKDMIIPAAHDAGMLAGQTHCQGVLTKDEWACEQDNSIFDSLRSGTRYFDLRFVAAKEYDCDPCPIVVQAHHTGVNLCKGIRMETILADVRDFLLQNPQEIVFLSISHFYGYEWSDYALAKVVATKVHEYLEVNGLLYHRQSGHSGNVLDHPAAGAAGKAIALWDMLTQDGKDVMPEPQVDGVRTDRRLYNLPYAPDTILDQSSIYPFTYSDGVCTTTPNGTTSAWTGEGFRGDCFKNRDQYADTPDVTVMIKDQIAKKMVNNNRTVSPFLVSWQCGVNTDSVLEGVTNDARALASSNHGYLAQELLHLFDERYSSTNNHVLPDSRTPAEWRKYQPTFVQYDFVDPWTNRAIWRANTNMRDTVFPFKGNYGKS